MQEAAVHFTLTLTIHIHRVNTDIHVHSADEYIQRKVQSYNTLALIVLIEDAWTHVE